MSTTSCAAIDEPLPGQSDDWDEIDYDPRKRSLLESVPAWFVSMVVHVFLLLALGLISIVDENADREAEQTLTFTPASDDILELEELEVTELDLGDVSDYETFGDPVVDISETIEISEPSELEPMDVNEVAIEMVDIASELAPTAVSTKTLASASMQPLGSRTPDMKEKMLRNYGGTVDSEKAVTEALKWLARHQLKNGSWSFTHNQACGGKCGDPGLPPFETSVRGATALALLPFLGAGQTHQQGEYKDNVYRGLEFLIRQGRAGKVNKVAMLDCTDPAGRMYSHALVSIVLCEAYAMTKDPDLELPAQASLNFLAAAQCRDGGWRYNIDSREGDTSVVGWAVMAFKSGSMGRLSVSRRTSQRTLRFLHSVSSPDGSGYKYMTNKQGYPPGTSAIGLLCRMYSGWDKTHPSIVTGVANLSRYGVLKEDIYYDYYAAQVLRHYGGEPWDKFNNELRDWLVEAQSQRGDYKGSWHFPDSRGHRGPLEGGRLASTCFATMILEVYYRHMPLYGDDAADENFPL